LGPQRIHAQCGATPPCVDSSDIVDGQVKADDLAKNAVSTLKIKADAVNGAKVADNSLSEADFSTAQRIVVAKSGGDFTSIGAALASITTSFPCPAVFVIDVLPGTYNEDVQMKSCVHLRGAGADAVHVVGTGIQNTLEIINQGVVEISGIEISNGANFASGLYVEGGIQIYIHHNRFVENDLWALFLRATGGTFSPRIVDNLVQANGRGIGTENSFAYILRNIFADNHGTDVWLTSGPAVPNVSFNVLGGVLVQAGVVAKGANNVDTAGDPVVL
jgi:hypothetical protein